MKKRFFILTLAIVLLFSCAACGQWTADGGNAAEEGTPENLSSSGLLTVEDVAALEALYGMDQDAVIETMSFSAEDVEQDDGLSLVPLERRTIAGQEFTQRYDFDASDPGGMYSVSYNAALDADPAEVAELIQTLYEDAVETYGEPNTYEGLANQISANLETIGAQGVKESYGEDWLVGEQTTVHLNAAPLDDTTLITLTYKMYVDVNTK